ncbi:MAG: hypothetical protein ACYSUS_06030 [Planctomycetota bacterium]|jgi:hypothetical protein
MIEKSKYENSLDAFHSILIKAKSMASEKKDHKDIYAFLDTAEYLVCLILEEDDRTEMFRSQLSLIARRFNFFTPIQYFDGEDIEELGLGSGELDFEGIIRFEGLKKKLGSEE